MNIRRWMQSLRRRLARPALPATHGQRGMTLLEILIVLAILGLVMGVLVGPRLYEMFTEGQDKVARTEVQKMATEAFIRWKTKNKGKQCPEITELAELLDKKQAKDPWDNDYVLFCGDNAPPGSKGFGVMSLGADGQEGTDDDIKSWEE